jgi:hypothetical protein
MMISVLQTTGCASKTKSRSLRSNSFKTHCRNQDE